MKGLITNIIFLIIPVNGLDVNIEGINKKTINSILITKKVPPKNLSFLANSSSYIYHSGYFILWLSENFSNKYLKVMKTTQKAGKKLKIICLYSKKKYLR